MKPEERQQALEAIVAEVAVCQACALHRGRKQTVPGDGSMSADLMFIGEAPGASEDEQGLPFVGRSGQYLNQLLDLIGLKRSEVFIANVVKCRPPDNRDPLPDEMDACRAYLDRQIELINPIMIATLGRFSMARYFPDGKITKIHGQPKIEEGRIYFPLFHPAAILRNPQMRPAMEDDFRRIKQLLDQVKSGELALGDEKPAVAPPPTDPPQQMNLF